MHVPVSSSRTTEQLLNLGFRDVASWVISPEGRHLECKLDPNDIQSARLLLDETNSLYAFAHENQVLYIGKTSRTVRRRFVTYRNPGKRQRTNLRCNRNIKEMLAAGKAVRILVFHPISHLRYREYEINLAAGLEDSLITYFDPPWNGREFGRPVSEEATREAEYESPAPSPIREHLLPQTGSLLPGKGAIKPTPLSSFEMALSQTYYRQGVINVGVFASPYLAGHSEPVTISFDDETEAATCRINRTANSSGGVRIVGKTSTIANWFQKNFKEGDVLKADVITRNEILLHRRSESDV
jgi:hypothetical protein